jgi:hypothetical protein
MNKDKNLRDEFAVYCEGLVKQNGVWNFYSDGKTNENSEFLLSKIEKFIDMLNIDDTIYMNMDIQNEIYDILIID